MKTFIKQNLNLFKIYLLGLILFAILRFIYLIRFGESAIFNAYKYDIISSFITGMRFDTQIICYSLLPIFLFNVLLLFNSIKIGNAVIKFAKYYTIVILSTLVIILFIDQQFYTYFQTHINILAYGLLEDDTSAVMSSVWSDHPVIKISLVILLFIFGIYKIIFKIYSSRKELKKTQQPLFNIGFIIILFGLFGLGIRGSIGIFPLQIDDSTVSENRFINILSLNGLFTLEKAIEERNESLKPIFKKEVLADANISSIKSVLSDYYSLPIDSFTSENYLDYLYETTKQDSFLESNPPNVIFILMESFGGYYLNFHSKELNLLGSLEDHLDDGVMFKNFLSSTRGTIYSLESIIISKNFPLISNTKERFKTFNSSIAFPYINAGYQTKFITGGKLGWRNLQDFIPNQHFQNSYGQATIQKNDPNAKTNTWGVYDEYLYEDIFKQLEKNSLEKQMIYALTTTNHTPYEIPANYIPYSLEVSDSINNLILANDDIALRNFRAYQYANDCLGKFLTRLKASKFGENTIVAVSGDHNSYALFPYNNSQIKEKDNHIVPFFLSIPNQYKKRLHINENRYGSHKDIFPSLINISLSNQKYFSLGNNLFEKNKADSLFYGINESFYFGDPKMSKEILDKKTNARQILNKYYFAQ